MSSRNLLMIATRMLVSMLTAVACFLVVGAVAFVTLPRLLNWQGTVVLTGSMEPRMPTGSLIFVDRDIDPAQMRVGEIVTFVSQGSNQITHRIVSIKSGPDGPEYQTKGDANNDPDEGSVKPPQVQRRVVATIPHAGSWSITLKNKANFKMIIWPILGLIILSETWNIIGQLRRGSKDANGGAVAAAEARPPLLPAVSASPASKTGRVAGD